MNDKNRIHIAAAVIEDVQGHVLLVRKKNTPFFMQPGGKIELGEASVSALVRELKEELQLTIDPQRDVAYIGRFTDIAANEPDYLLIADMYHVSIQQYDIVPAAEIEDIVWLDPAEQHRLVLAPLTEKQILPSILAARQNHTRNRVQ